MIELRVLGTLDLLDTEDGHAVRSVLAQPKRLALLCHLALARGFQQRETLLGLFWPETDPERARKALNQALSYLRRGLGEGVILTRNAGEVGVDPERLWCDAVAFEERLEAGDLAGALELYGGELLEGFYLTGCAGFERWAEGERERIRRHAVEAALELAATREAEGNGVAAVHRARQAASWAPYDERVLQRLMELLAEAGDLAGALRAYDAFATRLDEELEAEPSPETRVLAERLRSSPPPGGATDVAKKAAAPARDEEAVPAEPGRSMSGQRARSSEVRRHDAAPGPSPLGGRRAWATGWRMGAAALALLTAIVVAATFLNSAGESRAAAESANASPAAPELDPKRVLVAPFRNRTGEAELDVLGSLASDWVAQGLARAGGLTVVPPLDVLQESVRADTTSGGEREPGERRPWFGLAERTGAGTLVEGSYARQGDTLVFEVRLLDVADARVRHALEPVKGSAAQALESVEGLRRRIVAAVATHLDPGLGPWTSPASGLPPTPEAYRLFSEGMELFLAARGDRATFRKAADRFLEAARVDSGFTAPILWAAWAHANAGDGETVGALLDSLHSMRETLPPQERVAVEHLRARRAGDVEGAYRASRAELEMGPASNWRHHLTGDALQVGRPGEALSVLLQLEREGAVVSTWPAHWIRRAAARHWLGEHREELEDIRSGIELLQRLERLPPNHARLQGLRLREVWALAALGREEELAERIDELGDTSRRWSAVARALGELRVHGHEEAEARWLHAHLPSALAVARSDSALQAEIEGRWDPYRNLEAVLIAGGHWREARRVLERRVTNADPDDYILPGARAWLAMIAADHGEPEEAREVEGWLRGGERWGDSPGFKRYRATLRAAILAHLGEREAATTLLREEIGASGHWMWLHQLHPLYWWFEPLRGYAPYEGLLEPRG